MVAGNEGEGKQTAVATCAEGVSAEAWLTNRVYSDEQLRLQMKGPSLRYLDRNAVYTLKVTNPGSVPVAGVVLRETLPPSFRLLKAGDGGHQESSDTVTWSLGTLTPQESREVQFEAVAVAVGEQPHRAGVQSASGVHAEGQLLTRVEAIAALKLEVLEADEPLAVNSETAYEIRLTNTGSKTDTNIRVRAVLPDQVEFRKVQGEARYRVEGRTIFFEPIPVLEPQSEIILRIVGKVVARNPLGIRVRCNSDHLNESDFTPKDRIRVYSEPSDKPKP
jgi:hypothetical protein